MFHPVTEGDALYLEFTCQERLRLKRRPSVSSSWNISGTIRVRRPRSNSQVCKCLAVWSLVCSLIFLYLLFRPGKLGLYYLSLLELRLLPLADNISASIICETGVWKSQKIKHKCYFSLLSACPANPKLSPTKVPKQVIPQRVVLTSHSTNHTHKRPSRTFRCYMTTEASHCLSGSMTILLP